METPGVPTLGESVALVSFYLVWTVFMYSLYDAPIGTLLSGGASRTVTAVLFLWILGGVGLLAGIGISAVGRVRSA